MFYSFYSPDIEDHIYFTGNIVNRSTSFVQIKLNDPKAPVEVVVNARFPDVNFMLKESAKNDMQELISQGFTKIGVSTDGMRLLVAYGEHGWKLVRSGGLHKLEAVDEVVGVVVTNNELEFYPARDVDKRHLTYISSLAGKRMRDSFTGTMSYLKTCISICGLSLDVVEREYLPEQKLEVEIKFQQDVIECIKWIDSESARLEVEPVNHFIRDNEWVEPRGGITNIKLNHLNESKALSSKFSYEVYEAAFNEIIDR